MPQEPYNFKEKFVSTLQIEGRHDVYIAIRIPAAIEGATAIALADLMLQEQKRIRFFYGVN